MTGLIVIAALMFFLLMMIYLSPNIPNAPIRGDALDAPLIRSELEMLSSAEEARSLQGPINTDATPSCPHSDVSPNRWFLPEEFVVFDLETTGFSAGSAEIIEIGAVRISRDFSSKKLFQCLVKIDGKLPRKIVEITGITRKMINKDGRDAGQAISDFIEFIGELPLVAYNVKFDRSFLEVAASRHGYSLRNEFHCALEKSRLAWPGRSSYKLVDLARDGQLSDDGTHRALADARRALIVYAAAMTVIHSNSKN